MGHWNYKEKDHFLFYLTARGDVVEYDAGVGRSNEGINRPESECGSIKGIEPLFVLQAWVGREERKTCNVCLVSTNTTLKIVDYATRRKFDQSTVV